MMMLLAFAASVANSPIGATRLTEQLAELTVQVPAEHVATAEPVAPAEVLVRLAMPPFAVVTGVAEQKFPAPQRTGVAEHSTGAESRTSALAPPPINTE